MYVIVWCHHLVPIMVVWSVSDVRIVMEMLESFLHSEVSLHKPLHQMLTAVVLDGHCQRAAVGQVQAKEDNLKRCSCRKHCFFLDL